MFSALMCVFSYFFLILPMPHFFLLQSSAMERRSLLYLDCLSSVGARQASPCPPRPRKMAASTSLPLSAIQATLATLIVSAHPLHPTE